MMAINTLGEVEGGVEAELTHPPCPDCGMPGAFAYQTFDIVDSFFTIIDVYVCLHCHPEQAELIK